MTDPAELAELLRPLADLARAHGLREIVLRQPASLSWLLGARWNVPNTLDSSCFDVVVDLSGTPSVRIVTNVIEAPRLADTEVTELPVQWSAVPWWQSRDDSLPTGSGVGADGCGAGRVDLSAEIASLRRVLTTAQAGRLRTLSRDAAEATGAAARRVTPSMSEYQAAAVLSGELLDRGMEPACLFVAGGDRMGRHRHPLPTSATLGTRASLVCCARRGGLIASVTRIVCFGAPSAASAERYRRLLDVEAAFLAATRPGVRLGDVVQAGIEAYAANGFDPQEWTRHHQGGLTGWTPREFLAHPGTDLTIPQNGVVAWNPSGDTWKVEDTCLVDADGVHPLVHDATWPSVAVAGRDRPDLLVT